MRALIFAASVLALSSTAAGGAAPAGQGPAPSLSVKITSPLGRTGIVERVRIVALVTRPDGAELQPVKFFVDGTLLGADDDGPPYAIEWTDENPFEEREIRVEVADSEGAVAKDHVRLDPLRVTETTEVISVALDVSVHDRNGRFIGGLAAADFRLYEDGVPQTLDVVSQLRLGATFTLLVDSSQSMARRIDSVRGAASAFVRHLRPDDRIIVAPFTKTLGPVTGPTTDLQTVEEAIGAIESAGGTAILDALKTVSDRLKSSEGRQAIVLLTDGYDEHSTVPLTEALEALRGLHAPVYVIGVAGSAGISLKGERFLRALATETGGQAFFPYRDWQFDIMNGRVAEEVQQQYVMAYTPANQRRDGAWRRLTLATSNAEWAVRSRSGYFAPKPAPVRPSLEFTMVNSRRELLAVSVDDLIVREDGVEQKLETFEEAVAPVSMVLAMDGSGSMKKAAAGVQAAARSFVASVRPEDKLAVATFADGVQFHHEFSSERTPSYAGIDQYVANGGTALYDALFQSFERLEGIQGRRVVVVVTDGRDENNPGTAPGSMHTLDDVLSLMKQSDVTVFTIGLGPKVDREVLERLAAQSAGESYFSLDVADLEAHYRRVLENLRRRYVVSYTSSNPRRDGAWRAIEIISRIPDTTVISKGGFFAPPE